MFLRGFLKHLSARTMSSSSSTHLERTKHVVRDTQILADAVVTEITNISPTVKFLKVNIKDERVSFKPGQWVDFHIHGLSTVGGYSMCSDPLLLKEKRELHLAVKYSDHKPAHWVHTECVDGSEVKVKVGGTVYYDAFEEQHQNRIANNLLLIAGGVGINPLYSVFLHIYEASKRLVDSPQTTSTTLLYSAATKDELIFKQEIDSITSEDANFKASYFVTKEKEEDTDNIIHKRISKTDLQRMLEGGAYDHKTLVSYLCGPSPMMSEVKTYLLELGLDKKNIRYESWW